MLPGQGHTARPVLKALLLEHARTTGGPEHTPWPERTELAELGLAAGVPAPPAAWAGQGWAESAAEQGRGFLGTHGGPRLARPARPLCSPCLGPGQPSPGRSNHSLHLSREVQRVLFLLFYLRDGLAAAPLLACQPCWTGGNVTTKLTSTLRGDTAASNLCPQTGP